MHILPAIDMQDHQVVRLQQGRSQDATTYGNDIVAQAKYWANLGATHLHLVDLNGAFAGKPCHFSEIAAIIKALPNLYVQVGGGIRSRETLSEYFNIGVSACILGTVALKNPDFFREACALYPHKIILGVDAKNGMVATEGWADVSQTPATQIISDFAGLPLHSVIYTDIAKDGMLAGMNFSEILAVSKLGVPVTASGGLTALTDIDELLKIPNLFGVIAGKALYEDRFTLTQALAKVTGGKGA